MPSMGVRHAGSDAINGLVSCDSIPARCAPCPMLLLLAPALVDLKYRWDLIKEGSSRLVEVVEATATYY